MSTESSPALDVATVPVAREPLWKTAPIWVIGAGLLGWLFWSIPLDEALAAARTADLALLVPAVAGVVLLWFSIEATAFAYLFSRFDVPVAFGEARAARALSYPATVLHWDLGNGALILYMRRTKGIRVLKALGNVYLWEWVGEVSLYIVFLLGMTSLPPVEGLRTAMWLALLGLTNSALQITVMRSTWPHWGWLERVRMWSIVRAFRFATARDFAVLAGLRMLHFAGSLVLYSLATRAFHADVPLATVAASLPLVLVAGRFPTPAGLGTQQAAVVYLYGPYGGEAAMLALSLSITVLTLLTYAALAIVHAGSLRGLTATPAVSTDRLEAAAAALDDGARSAPR
jgi:hypothetical protein